MYKYAIDEIYPLVHRLSSPINHREPDIRYLCALFAELAYYHIPQWEIDGNKRAKLIPCERHHVLAANGRPTDVINLLRSLDLSRSFVVVDRGVVAVGIQFDKLLFIGFRGTQFLFDWKINMRSRLVPINAKCIISPHFIIKSMSGRLHSGFAEEARRISTRVLDAIKDLNPGKLDHVFLTGHSLGGAVAAIAENFVNVAPTSACIFGAPRYSDLSAYFSLSNFPPVQVRRPGDIVPTVPPKIFGYADHPYEFTTNGCTYIDPASYASVLGGFVRWVRFLAGRFEPHNIEVYRQELGRTAGAEGSRLPLAPFERLTADSIDPP